MHVASVIDRAGVSYACAGGAAINAASAGDAVHVCGASGRDGIHTFSDWFDSMELSKHGDPGIQAAHDSARAGLIAALKECLDSIVAAPGELLAGSGVASAESTAALRGCIVQYSSALRAQGETPERALIAFKRVLHDVVPRSVDTDAFTRTAVGWCIEAYYSAEPPPRPTPPRAGGGGLVSG